MNNGKINVYLTFVFFASSYPRSGVGVGVGVGVAMRRSASARQKRTA
jgi:hypothetical protein